MSKLRGTCFIHAGTHKTATSAIQTFLGANRERFAAAGVIVPWAGSDSSSGIGAHHDIVQELMGAPTVNSVNGGLTAMTDELRRSDARTACISSENFCFLWDNPPALVRLRDAITEAGFKPQIVMYLRPQASYCTAVYAESVRQGFRTGFATYLKDVLTRGHWVWNGSVGPPFDYNELLAPFAAVFGPESIIARAYRPAAADDAIFADFARLLLPPELTLAGFSVPTGRENRSLDFGAILELLGADKAITEAISFAPMGIGPTLRLGLRYRAANAKIAARYSIALPVLEPRDLALALPLRTTPAKTWALADARRTLARRGHIRTRVCYIHIGTHKTGTTSIQAFLAENPRRFIDNGVFLPKAGREDDIGVVAHHELAKDLLGSPLFKPERGGLEAVVEELRAAESDVACLTSEDLSYLYHKPQALIRLRNGIRSAGYEPRVLVYLRPQASYCASLYAKNVRQGYRVPFEHYLADVLNHGCYFWDGVAAPPLDYCELLDGFAAVFGKQSIEARAYRSGRPSRALLYSFARLLAPRAYLEDFRFPHIRHNGSPTFGQVLEDLGSPVDANEKIRFTPIDLRDTLRIGARFLVPNLRLARRYRVVVPMFEPIDVALAFPFRKTRAKTIALARTRRALSRYGKLSRSSA